MQQFKINEAGFKKFKKRWLTITVPIMSVVVIIITLTNTFSGKTVDTGYLLIVFPIVVIFLGFNMYRGFRKQKKFLASYSVTLTDNEIIREQMNTPPLTINFMEIKEIAKTEKGAFIIKGLTRADVIGIPQ